MRRTKAKTERTTKGKCLHCDGNPERRGLCQRCFSNYYRRQLKSEDPEAFDRVMVARGAILEPWEMSRLKRRTPFD